LHGNIIIQINNNMIIQISEIKRFKNSPIKYTLNLLADKFIANIDFYHLLVDPDYE
jgi:hypothetical protein